LSYLKGRYGQNKAVLSSKDGVHRIFTERSVAYDTLPSGKLRDIMNAIADRNNGTTMIMSDEEENEISKESND
jgi:hypothetical protein